MGGLNWPKLVVNIAVQTPGCSVRVQHTEDPIAVGGMSPPPGRPGMQTTVVGLMSAGRGLRRSIGDAEYDNTGSDGTDAQCRDKPLETGAIQPEADGSTDTQPDQSAGLSSFLHDGSWLCSSCRLCDVLGAGRADEATVERRDQDAGLGMLV